MALQWVSLVGAIWLQTINGTNSNFPAYSSHLKHLMSISQLQLNNLAVASDAGKLFGWFSGLAATHLPLWSVLLIGSLLGLIGYGLQFLFLTNQISLSYTHVLLLTLLAGTSICWINTVCNIIAIQNFQLDRLIAVGLSTSYISLSAKIYTDIVDAVFPNSPLERARGYLLLNSVLPLGVCLIAVFMVRVMKIEKSRRIESGFVELFVITILTGVFAVVTSLDSVPRKYSRMFLVGMGLLLLAPLLIPMAEQIRERLEKKCRLRRERRVHELSVVEEVEVEIGNGGNGVVIKDEEKDEDDDGVGVGGSVMREIGARVMMKSVEFWLYFFVYLFGATIGLVFMNNLGQIAESRGCTRTSSLVSLSSSFGFFGRLLPSLLDYFLSKSKYNAVSRPASMASMMAPMFGAFFLLLNGAHICLYISTATIGICTGAITSISVSTTTDLFGSKNFSVNHNILVTNIPIGSFVFGGLAALLYRRQARRGDDNGNGGGMCMGVECYRTTFIVWGCLCFVGTFLALLLHRRTRKFYSHKL